MKKISIKTTAFCTAATLLSSCIEETFPTDVASTEQVAKSTTALKAQARDSSPYECI